MWNAHVYEDISIVRLWESHVVRVTVVEKSSPVLHNHVFFKLSEVLFSIHVYRSFLISLSESPQ